MASVDLPFVPVLDYSQSDEELVDHLHAALSTVGFACLKNTDVWSQVRSLDIYLPFLQDVHWNQSGSAGQTVVAIYAIQAQKKG